MEINQIDLLVKNTLVYNTYFKKFYPGDVWIKDGKIYYIDVNGTDSVEARQVVDGGGRYMIPGLIDIHMHIESSMMTPEAFCNYVVGCGVTTLVSEPHEIANVAGIRGIEAMIAAGKNTPVDVFYGIPSCVPSTSEELETTGGIITCEDMEKLKDNPYVACVGEVMSYRQIIKENDLEIGTYIEKLRKTDKIFPIEGHCPSLVDLDLAKFLYLGINGDHTEHTIEELRQRFAAGMFIEIQEKMLKKEVIDFIQENHLEEHFCFVTDDVMADTLIQEGHLDVLVRKAIALGMTPEQAIYNATYTPARRMNLLDRGTLAPGKAADFSLVSDLVNFKLEAVYKNGQEVWSPDMEISSEKAYFPEEYYHTIQLEEQTEDSLAVKVDREDGIYPVRVMEIGSNGTRTKQTLIDMEVKDGLLKWEDTGCLLVTVFERYGRNHNIGLGFLTGVCHKSGAVASSYAHDSHNIIAAGDNHQDILAALNRVIELQGGMVVAKDGELLAELALPVGGILSDQPARTIGNTLGQVRAAMEQLGYDHYNPIMSFATLTLPVSPALKITDRGLIDVERGVITGLILDR
ncbi:MAG: adenine deaminase [Lachnospiraceae bacterium]